MLTSILCSIIMASATHMGSSNLSVTKFTPVDSNVMYTNLDTHQIAKLSIKLGCAVQSNKIGTPKLYSALLELLHDSNCDIQSEYLNHYIFQVTSFKCDSISYFLISANFINWPIYLDKQYRSSLFNLFNAIKYSNHFYYKQYLFLPNSNTWKPYYF
jgi:hypothetical protein